MNDLPEHPLIAFLSEKMSMTDVYQPAIIKDLLEHGGVRSKSDLAGTLAAYDTAIQEYYEKVVMRWPKITLTKHDMVSYERSDRSFNLVHYPEDEEIRLAAIAICNDKIGDWLEKRARRGTSSDPDASTRYLVLKEAHGKCELCGVSSSLRPIDVDHIIPRSKANKHGKVSKDGVWIDVDARENLQALCMTCNRAKRDADQTDFRRTSKLVRDKIPEIIRSEGREPDIAVLSGKSLNQALLDKLVEEHAELLAAKDNADARLEELVDMAEVIVAMASRQGVDEAAFLEALHRKRQRRGAFEHGYLLFRSST